jgi:thiosulfate dehydrogenase (quinone) large subunit
MIQSKRVSIVLLRIAMGWLFLYAGLSKVLNPNWSAQGYLKSAKTFPELYQWLALPSNIEWVNFLNQWGLTIVGAALILGLFVRWAALAAIAFMVLYYLPILSFPRVGANSYLVDEHIIFILVLAALYIFNAGKYWGLDALRKSSQ